MPLTAGTRLGPYEIVAPLGAGGMGEVYRARDTRLDRAVAVKVLPQHLSANPEVRARFEREAKTISSLNHPHICTLFDVGREGEIDYLVMELLEGETLQARLAKGALPAVEVLKLGGQIADALDRAHRAGVIHRDLKPGNIMLTKSGAKLMDFGLARATGMAGPGGTSGLTHAALTQSPTIAAPLTAEGTIVGTFQYMSPEQLEGKDADERSDLWALGCVLFEMATGRRAFEGRSQATLITAIMSTEPPPVSQVAPLAPPGLDRLVRTCLTKDPDERVRTAHDVKLQLLGLAEGGSQYSAIAPAAARVARRSRLAWAVAGLATLVAVAFAYALMNRSGTPPAAVQLELSAPEGQHLLPYPSTMSISPDGRFVAFCVLDSNYAPSTWVRRLDSSDAIRIAPIGAVGGMFWSPDSRALGVINAASGKLMTIPVTGGTPSVIGATSVARGGTWNRDGVIVYAPNPQGPLFRINSSGGEPVQVTWPDSSRHEIGHRFPCFLPDGDHFLYVSLPPGPDGFDIYVGSLKSRTTKKLFSAQSAPKYAAPGFLLFRREDKLVAQRFDAGRLTLDNDPIPLADLAPETDLSAEPVATASNDGRLVAFDNRSPNTRIGWLDLNGALRGNLDLPEGPWGLPALSPDDRYAIVENGDDLWRLDLARSAPLRLTTNRGYHAEPIWSPDGSQFAFTARREGHEEIYLMSSDGSGAARMLSTTADLFKNATDWSREGLIFTNIGATTFRDVWIAPTSEGAHATPLIQSRFSEYGAVVSPDGHWIAYICNEAGSDDAYIQSFPIPGHKTRVSSGGAGRVWWLPGSDGVCYRTADRTQFRGVKLTRRGDELEVGEPRTLFSYPAGVESSDLSHDGQRMMVCYSSPGSQNRVARVILNWTELLKR